MSPSFLRSAALSSLVALALLGQAVHAEEEYSTDPDDPNYKRPVAGYIPTMLPAVIFAGIFGLLTLVSWIQYGKRRLILIFPIGLTAMTAGFGVRVYCHYSPYSIPIYSASMLLILLSPCAYLAACYQMLGIMANVLGPDSVALNCLPIRTSRVTKIFVTSDLSTFVLQCAGSGAAAVGGNIANIGHWVALIGLIIQLASFGIYICLLALFGWRVRSMYPELWRHSDGRFSWSPAHVFSREDVDHWKVVYWSTAYTCFALLIRCVFRCVEYSQGFDGELATTEWWGYVFDSIPLAFGTAAYCYFWPARFLSAEGADRAHGAHKLVPLTSQSTYMYGQA